MPAVKYLGTGPEIDWLKGAIYAQMDAKGMDKKTLAAKSKINYETLRKMFTKSPWDWKPEQRDKICRLLDISKDVQRATMP